MSDAATQPPASPGLPPVAPPSGRFILQLFLVPGLIVGVIVLIILTANWLFVPSRSPEQFLSDLDSDNESVAWQAAADLSQVLPRPGNTLESDAEFALAITERLDKRLKRNREAEARRREEIKKARGEPGRVPKALEMERDLITYLIGCVGTFRVPVGAPLLREIALAKEGADTEVGFRHRVQAVIALTALGKNIQRFDQLSKDRQREVLDYLREEARDSSTRGRWAAEALAYLEGGDKAPRHVGDALCRIADDSSPYLRKWVAAALTHWQSDRAEDVLVKLTQDDGKGEDPITFDPEQQEYQQDYPAEVREQNRRDIRYNAVLTLARRGSMRTLDLIPLVEEMLDLEKQQQWLAASHAPGQKEAAAAHAERNVLAALNALEQFHAAHPDLKLDLRGLDDLVDSDNKTVSVAARALRTKLKK